MAEYETIETIDIIQNLSATYTPVSELVNLSLRIGRIAAQCQDPLLRRAVVSAISDKAEAVAEEAGIANPLAVCLRSIGLTLSSMVDTQEDMQGQQTQNRDKAAPQQYREIYELLCELVGAVEVHYEGDPDSMREPSSIDYWPELHTVWKKAITLLLLQGSMNDETQ